jgi:hypothetical protein
MRGGYTGCRERTLTSKHGVSIDQLSELDSDPSIESLSHRRLRQVHIEFH